MNIVIAAQGNNVAGHFGHCEKFVFVEVAGDKIIAINEIENPGHKPGFLPNFLADRGANVIISGGMGAGATTIFNQRNVKVIVGASGNIEDVVKDFLAGKLESSGSVCNKHEHAHECGNH